jgi:DNA-directed RNA polymerase specialized sigma subunit
VGKRLSDDHKTVLQLTYVVGLMEDDVAGRMGIDRDEVSHLKRHALGALRADSVK